MGYQEEIDKIDQRLADMDYVQAKMTEQGISSGEYDLDSLASLRARERVKEEEALKAQEAELQNMRDQRMLTEPLIGGDSFTPDDPPSRGLTRAAIKKEPTIIKTLDDEFKVPVENRPKSRENIPLSTMPLGKKEALEHQKKIDWWKEKRALLNEELLKDEDAKKVYDEIVKTPPEKRQAIFDKLERSYQLKPGKMAEVLGGEDEYKKYVDTTKELLGRSKEVSPKLSSYFDVYGKGDLDVADPWHGLRSATVYEYEEPSEASAVYYQEKYK